MANEDSPSLDASNHFDAAKSKRYDTQLRNGVPGYDALHHMVHRLLRAYLPEEANVLVVGGGTGKEVLTCAPSSPGWRFTVVEPSPEMAALCLDTCARQGLSERIELHQGYLDGLPEGQTFDAATAILVCQFVKEESKRTDLLIQIAARLKPGDPLVLVDLSGDRRTESFKLMLTSWKDYYTKGEGPETVKHIFAHLDKDIGFLPEDRIAKMLEECGFEPPQPFYRAFLFVGWVTRRK